MGGFRLITTKSVAWGWMMALSLSIRELKARWSMMSSESVWWSYMSFVPLPTMLPIGWPWVSLSWWPACPLSLTNLSPPFSLLRLIFFACWRLRGPPQVTHWDFFDIFIEDGWTTHMGFRDLMFDFRYFFPIFGEEDSSVSEISSIFSLRMVGWCAHIFKWCDHLILLIFSPYFGNGDCRDVVDSSGGFA